VLETTQLSRIERCRMGNAQAWEELVQIYRPFLIHCLRGYFLHEPDKDDLAQEALAVVLEELSGFIHNKRKGAFRLWLRTIVSNRARQFLRGRRVQEDVESQLNQLDDPNSSLSKLWEQQHAEYVVRRLLEMIRPAFKENTWQAFYRVTIEKTEPARVAADLGLTVNAVFVAKSKVLAKLREEASEFIDF
jgi:RNA polymerase sigma-70 factor, ECF subfamily